MTLTNSLFKVESLLAESLPLESLLGEWPPVEFRRVKALVQESLLSVETILVESLRADRLESRLAEFTINSLIFESWLHG